MTTTHTVQQGECLSSIAHNYGFSDWHAIYDDPDNADFKKARPNPHVIQPGDQLVIPDKKELEKFESCATEKKHVFKVKRPYVLLRVVVKDEEEKPISGKKYELVVGGEKFEGKTDGDGTVEERVNPSATSAELTIFLEDDPKGEHLHWELAIGHLDPVTELTGVQARLNNLGFWCGPPDGRMGKKTKAAIKGFQESAGLKPSGKLDDATRDKLVEMHGKM